MTAEVVVLNRHAVALAADSAVTVSGGRRNKIYNAANKVFALSKREPVGVMVYGNAEFMGLPWETIIKVYRSQLGDTSFQSLADYYDHFISFLGSNEDLFGEALQRKYAEELATWMFNEVRESVRLRIDAFIKASGGKGIGDDEVAKLRSDAIEEYRREVA